MEIHVVEGNLLAVSRWTWAGMFPPLVGYNDAVFRDPNGRDGEWHAVVSMPHEVVEWEEYGVPAFEGDAERIEWERRRRVELRY